jgi:hypothetical protein
MKNDDIIYEAISITSAEYITEYSIEITFSDCSKKLVDFKSFLSKSSHPSVSKYLDKNLFRSYEIKDGNLNWNDYDLIFPVYDLYEGKIN